MVEFGFGVTLWMRHLALGIADIVQTPRTQAQDHWVLVKGFRLKLP